MGSEQDRAREGAPREECIGRAFRQSEEGEGYFDRVD